MGVCGIQQLIIEYRQEGQRKLEYVLAAQVSSRSVLFFQLLPPPLPPPSTSLPRNHSNFPYPKIVMVSRLD